MPSSSLKPSIELIPKSQFILIPTSSKGFPLNFDLLGLSTRLTLIQYLSSRRFLLTFDIAMSRYQPPSSDRRRLLQDPPLPKGFTSIKDILDDGIRHGKTVSVIGVVKDYMLPRSTVRDGEKIVPRFCVWLLIKVGRLEV